MSQETTEKGIAAYAHYSEARRFRPEAFTPVAIGRGRHLKAMLVCFEPGQFIPVHAPALELALIVLEGTGRMVAGDEEISLQPGAVAFVPAEEMRGIEAETRLTAFQVVSPVPTAADHAGVRAGLERGSWR